MYIYVPIITKLKGFNLNKLLKIDTSIRNNNSHSRDLANKYETKWQSMHSEGSVTYRDLSQTDIPHVSHAFIEAMYTSEENKNETIHNILSLSDELISELKEADTILLSTPMYNFSVPSKLKAYIDHISRIGETFSKDESGYTGLLTGKKLVIIAAYGADFSQMRSMDFLEPYLKTLFGFLGFTDVEYYAIEETNMLDKEELEVKKLALERQFN